MSCSRVSLAFDVVDHVFHKWDRFAIEAVTGGWSRLAVARGAGCSPLAAHAFADQANTGGVDRQTPGSRYLWQEQSGDDPGIIMRWSRANREFVYSLACKLDSLLDRNRKRDWRRHVSNILDRTTPDFRPPPAIPRIAQERKIRLVRSSPRLNRWRSRCHRSCVAKDGTS